MQCSPREERSRKLTLLDSESFLLLYLCPFCVHVEVSIKIDIGTRSSLARARSQRT